MSKDKEWLKDEIKRLSYVPKGLDGSNSVISTNWAIKFINQLDEPEITEEQAWNKIAESYPADAKSLAVSFEHFYYEGFSKKEIPVIPQFVADWIERNKQPDYDYDSKEDALADSIHFTLYSLEANYPETNTDVIFRKPVNEWLENDRKNYWKLIDAVRYGYEVEKEKLYWIVMPTGHIAYRCGDGISYVTEHYKESSDSEKFTEAEIKAIDERLWSFAEEITE